MAVVGAAPSISFLAEARIGNGNSVYAKLIKLANTCKNIWQPPNKLKNNNYVFDDTSKVTVVPVAPTT